MPEFTDAASRVTAWPLQTRTDDTGTEVAGEHFDGKDGATLLGAFTSGIVTPATAFQVSQDTGSNMKVRVGSGAAGDLAFIEGSDPLQGVYSVAWPEADTVVEINAADVSNPRYTSVFLVVAHDQFDTGGFTLPRIATVDGTSEASPSPPAYDGSEKAVLRLADILVGTGVTEITDADITDQRAFASLDVDVAADRVATAAIQDEAVTTPKIANQAVDTDQIAPAAVFGNRLLVEGIATDKVVPDFLQGFEVDNSTEVASQALTSSLASVASVTLSIPASWNSWKCYAVATWVADTPDAAAIYDAVLRIDGTDQQVMADIQLSNDTPGSVVGRRAGMTTTGSRTVALRARETGANDVVFNDIALYARAVRTS